MSKTLQPLRILVLLLLFILLPSVLLGVISCSEVGASEDGLPEILPDFVGTSYSEETDFTVYHPFLSVKKIVYELNPAPRGTVIGQSHPAGMEIPDSGLSLVLRVSMGPPNSVKLSFTGDYRLAKMELENRMDTLYGKGNWNIDFRVNYKFSEEPAGQILDFTNENGTKTVSRNCVLDVTVSANIALLDHMVGWDIGDVRHMLDMCNIQYLNIAVSEGKPKNTLVRVLITDDGAVLYYEK